MPERKGQLHSFKEILHAEYARKYWRGSGAGSCDEVETVWEFAYLCDRVSVGCEAAVTATTRSGWIKHRECGELLYDRFPLKLKTAVYKRLTRPAILYGSEAWCLKESEMGILRNRERSTVRAMCEIQVKDRKTSMDLMYMLGMNEITYQLAMESCLLA